MKKGKIDLKSLNEIISTYTGEKRAQTYISPKIGEDVCALDLKKFDEDVMLISSDPITFTSKNIGKLVITINTNDIYASGGVGYGIILNVFIPEDKTLDDFKNLMKDIHDECVLYNLEILGGHTEVTNVVNDIVVSVTIIGLGKKDSIVKTSTSNRGDAIFLTKTLGVEGTTILFDEFNSELIEVLTPQDLIEIEKFRDKLSIRKEAKLLRKFKITSMHDVTEGGLIGALFEMSISSNNGFRIFKDKIIVHDVTKKICQTLNKNIYRLISSGNLLFTCDKAQANNIINTFSNENIECSIIGEIIEDGKYFMNDGTDNIIDLDIEDSFFN